MLENLPSQAFLCDLESVSVYSIRLVRKAPRVTHVATPSHLGQALVTFRHTIARLRVNVKRRAESALWSSRGLGIASSEGPAKRARGIEALDVATLRVRVAEAFGLAPAAPFPTRPPVGKTCHDVFGGVCREHRQVENIRQAVRNYHEALGKTSAQYYGSLFTFGERKECHMLLMVVHVDNKPTHVFLRCELESPTRALLPKPADAALRVCTLHEVLAERAWNFASLTCSSIPAKLLITTSGARALELGAAEWTKPLFQSARAPTRDVVEKGSGRRLLFGIEELRELAPFYGP